MKAISVEELARRPARLIEEAESGQVAVVTKDGRPLFLAVPYPPVPRGSGESGENRKDRGSPAEWVHRPPVRAEDPRRALLARRTISGGPPNLAPIATDASLLMARRHVGPSFVGRGSAGLRS